MVMASKMTPQSSVVGGREPELAQTSVPVVRTRADQLRAHLHAHPRGSQLTPQTSVGSRAARSRRVGLAQEKVSTATVFPPTLTKEEPTCSGFSHSLRAVKAGVSLAGKRKERKGHERATRAEVPTATARETKAAQVNFMLCVAGLSRRLD